MDQEIEEKKRVSSRMSFSLRASHQNNCELRYEDQNIYSNRKTIIYTKELLGFVEPSFV